VWEWTGERSGRKYYKKGTQTPLALIVLRINGYAMVSRTMGQNYAEGSRIVKGGDKGKWSVSGKKYPKISPRTRKLPLGLGKTTQVGAPGRRGGDRGGGGTHPRAMRAAGQQDSDGEKGHGERCRRETALERRKHAPRRIANGRKEPSGGRTRVSTRVGPKCTGRGGGGEVKEQYFLKGGGRGYQQSGARG